MPTLKETKTRIESVKSTLKTTSAMKLVSAAKLHRQQAMVEGLHPYESGILNIFDRVMRCKDISTGMWTSPREARNVAIVAVSSNSSLCGAFNANIIRLAQEAAASHGEAQVTVYSAGRKMADAMRKGGFPSPGDYNTLSDKPSYEKAAALAHELSTAYLEGKFDCIELVYTHFVSSARQIPVRRQWLPFTYTPQEGEEAAPETQEAAEEDDFILEPSPQALFESLLPRVLKLALYGAFLDSSTSEHAARTVAMQTATDNAENLLSELTLQYNKSRQQKITAEILDLSGGMQE